MNKEADLVTKELPDSNEDYKFDGYMANMPFNLSPLPKRC